MDTKQLWIQKLECIYSNPQGTDECYLDIYLDNIQQPSLRMILSAGQSWTINESFPFQSQVEVKLSYQNSQYNNDLSEIVRLQTQSSSEILTVCFHLGSGFYQLFYKVTFDQLDGGGFMIGINAVPTPGPTPTPTRRPRPIP
jgi:hypothetical protein